MKKEIKIALIVFIALEILFALYGAFYMNPVICDTCPDGTTPKSYELWKNMALAGIAPSLIISLATYFLLKRYSGKNKK